MKIAVLGAGAMGSLYGAKLSRTQDVTMVDVNETLIDHINQNGIVMQEADGTEETYNLKAVKSAGSGDRLCEGYLHEGYHPAESVDDRQQHAGHDVAERRRQQP